MEAFLAELNAVMNKHFPGSDITYQLKTSQSLKISIPLKVDLFISVRYNARNGRKDYALISGGQRVFGCDNLKTWHVHPFGSSEMHLSCVEPLLEQIFIEIKDICARIEKREGIQP